MGDFSETLYEIVRDCAGLSILSMWPLVLSKIEVVSKALCVTN